MKKSCTNIECQKVYTKDLKINTRYIHLVIIIIYFNALYIIYIFILYINEIDRAPAWSEINSSRSSNPSFSIFHYIVIHSNQNLE